MARPNHKKSRGRGRPPIYKTSDGKRVPSGTTIISRYKESGGLIHWAWTVGTEGKDYREMRDSAGSTGHIAHAMIEHDIHGTEYTPPESATEEQVELARQGFSAYQQWAEQSRLHLLETEVPLVSDKHLYAGCLDAVGQVSADLVLVDWKTSNAVYRDYVVQLAAYRELWRECRDEDLTSAHLLRVGKEHADFHHHHYPASILDIAWDYFKTIRYELDKQLKKAVG
jgi:hypothetical protein